MSRTYRRKNAKEAARYFFLDRPWYWGDGIVPDYHSKEYRRELAKWQSDKERGWSPPKSWRQSFNRDFRSKNKAILSRAIRENDVEPMFLPFIKDCAWYYF